MNPLLSESYHMYALNLLSLRTQLGRTREREDISDLLILSISYYSMFTYSSFSCGFVILALIFKW